MIEHLRPKLTDLWEDIRIEGLPVGCDRGRGFAIGWHVSGEGWACITPFLGGTLISEMYLDLTRPGASDLLARRVAQAAGWNGEHTPTWRYLPGMGWMFVPIDCWDASWLVDRNSYLLDLDPTCNDRFDWSNLGAPRKVDLAALSLVGQHLCAAEKEKTDAD